MCAVFSCLQLWESNRPDFLICNFYVTCSGSQSNDQVMNEVALVIWCLFGCFKTEFYLRGLVLWAEATTKTVVFLDFVGFCSCQMVSLQLNSNTGQNASLKGSMRWHRGWLLLSRLYLNRKHELNRWNPWPHQFTSSFYVSFLSRVKGTGSRFNAWYAYLSKCCFSVRTRCIVYASNMIISSWKLRNINS